MPWPKGKPRSEETKKKMSELNKGKRLSGEHRRKISEAMKGKKNTLGHKHSKETKMKIRESLKGRILTKAWKRKLSLSKKGKIGSKSNSWKGDEAGYRAKHLWIKIHFGHAKNCIFNPNHVASKYHWANISGKYTRNLIDYAPMCPSCHGLFDKNK